jgi:hypothetical protein
MTLYMINIDAAGNYEVITASRGIDDGRLVANSPIRPARHGRKQNYQRQEEGDAAAVAWAKERAADYATVRG